MTLKALKLVLKSLGIFVWGDRLAMVLLKRPIKFLSILYPFRTRMRIVQALKRHQACKRARMLKRIASDVTEPASPDAVLHHNVDIERSILFFRRMEANREEFRRRMEDIELQCLREIGLLNGPPATFVNDIVNTGLDDPIYEQ